MPRASEGKVGIILESKGECIIMQLPSSLLASG
jgi:hypothetical protein